MNSSVYDLNISEDEDVPLAKLKLNGKRNRKLSIADRSSCVSDPAEDKKAKWDNYCWGCHKECRSAVKCSNCFISFHKNCTPDMNRNRIGWRCLECQNSKKCQNDDGLRNSLKYVVERVLRKTLKNDKFDVPNDYMSSTSMNPVTFADIVDKVKRSEYASMHAFLLDFKWLRHNCEILYFNISKQEKKNVTTIRNIARTLLINVEKEMESLKKCADCYVNNNIDIFSVCSKPHLLLWAQYDIYPYWPVKILNINEASKTLEVYFFNDHTSADVLYDNCFLYFNEDPNNYITDQYKDDIKKAMEEANKYIEKVEQKFGPMQLPKTFIKPTPRRLDTVHLDEIIPGFRNPEHRVVHQNVKQEPFGYDNDHDINDDTPDIVNLNLNETKFQHRSKTNSSEINFRNCLPINKLFIDKVRACQKAMREIKSERDEQRTEIIMLRKENEQLKRKLAHSKWSSDFSRNVFRE